MLYVSITRVIIYFNEIREHTYYDLNPIKCIVIVFFLQCLGSL